MENSIISFVEDKTNHLYFGGIGAKNYLFSFDELSQSFTNLSVPLPFDAADMEVHDIVCDSQGHLWLGTTHGMLKYDLQSKSVDRADLGEHMITTTEIRGLTIDKYDQIWVSTDVFGVMCYKNGEVTKYELSDGIPSKTNYYRSTLIDRTERIWVGTDAGYTYSRDIAPQIVRTVQPQLYYAKVNGFSKHFSPEERTEVPFKNAFEIGFHSISYPSKSLSYQWRILGKDENKWSEESPENHFTVPGLEHGDFAIEIRARQLGYGWSEPLLIRVEVQQVWYLKGWAFILYILLLLLLMTGASHINSRRLFRSNKRLQEKVDSKTLQLQEKNLELTQQNEYISQQADNLEALNQLKDRLFSIISHDLRGPVGSIKSVLSLISNDIITEKEFKDITPKLAKELDKTSFLLDNLLNWARSQMDGDILQLKRVLIHMLLNSAAWTIP